MPTFDRNAYEVWLKQCEGLLPSRITCPDCNGTGEGECPHCGSWTDCDTCNGDGYVRPSVLLTPDFYRRVMRFEQERLKHWIAGDAIATKDEKGITIEHHNPLTDLVLEYQPKRDYYSFPRIALWLPLTEPQ